MIIIKKKQLFMANSNFLNRVFICLEEELNICICPAIRLSMRFYLISTAVACDAEITRMRCRIENSRMQFTFIGTYLIIS